jgi:DNA-directed RNA polymerase specialized sigma24 family protein
MESIVVDLTPRLRRYAHALLGSWPAAPRATGEAVPCVDQDADDLVHEALLGFWRASPQAAGAPLRIALYRRVTVLASGYFARKAREILASEILAADGRRAGPDETPAGEPRHFAWAPEARALPRLTLDLRALLALVALERMSYAEAGAVLGMTAERALIRLAVARAQLASAISGEKRSHLAAISEAAGTGRRRLALAGGPVTEGDLHRFVDELLDQRRSAEISAHFEAHPDVMRRAREWRRHSERLRRAFEPLLSEPLPLSLNFAAPETSVWGRRRPLPTGDGLLRRLVALLAPPDSRAQAAQRPV